MDFGNVMFWAFLAAATVASLTFVSIVVWAENRRKERQELNQFDFRNRLIDAGKMDAASLASLIRYENDLKTSRGRQKLLVAAFVFIGTGLGVGLGLQFVAESVWMLGVIPASIGLCMLVYCALFAPKTNPGPAPFGWSPEVQNRG